MDILAATHYSIEDDKCGTETYGLAGVDDKISLQLAEQKGVLILTEKQNHHCPDCREAVEDNG